MNKSIFIVCGVLNGLFAAFHVVLGLGIQRLPSLIADYRALMQALNFSGLLCFVFLAVAFLACQADLRSRLGRATILLGAVIYLTRALEEFVLFPRVGWIVFGLCVITGLLHVVAWREARTA